MIGLLGIVDSCRILCRENKPLRRMEPRAHPPRSCRELPTDIHSLYAAPDMNTRLVRPEQHGLVVQPHEMGGLSECRIRSPYSVEQRLHPRG